MQGETEDVLKKVWEAPVTSTQGAPENAQTLPNTKIGMSPPKGVKLLQYDAAVPPGEPAGGSPKGIARSPFFVKLPTAKGESNAKAPKNPAKAPLRVRISEDETDKLVRKTRFLK